MSTPVTTSLNPWAPISQTHRVRVYQRGRRCAHAGCDTILSIYNPAKYCSAHVQTQNKRRRSVTHSVQEVTCEHCAAAFETANPRRRYCSDRCRMAAFARRKRSAQRVERRAQKAKALRAAAPEREPVGSAA